MAVPGRVRRFLRRLTWWQETLLLVIVAICLTMLVRSLVAELFWIPSGSMEQALQVGDRVLVNKVVYDYRDPHRGEVVVFHGGGNWSVENAPQRDGPLGAVGRALFGGGQPGTEDFVKRVIGVPGDVVACCDRGRVTVNGVALTEPYLFEDSPVDAPPSPGECRSRRFRPYRVRPGEVFVLGDHRGVSQDSRCQGPVPRRAILGRAVAVAWPPGHWRTLPVPATFDRLPG